MRLFEIALRKMVYHLAAVSLNGLASSAVSSESVGDLRQLLAKFRLFRGAAGLSLKRFDIELRFHRHADARQIAERTYPITEVLLGTESVPSKIMPDWQALCSNHKGSTFIALPALARDWRLSSRFWSTSCTPQPFAGPGAFYQRPVSFAERCHETCQLAGRIGVALLR